MADRGSYSSAAAVATDPRRAYRMAERMIAAQADPLSRSTIPPGSVWDSQAALNQLVSSGVNFDRAGFAFDGTAYTAYTCNGSATPAWTKVGSRPNNLRLGLGQVSDPIYVWIWAAFNWANNGTAADGRCVACLYDTYTPSLQPCVRASNIQSTWTPLDNKFRQQFYIGFIAIDPSSADFSGANGGFTGQGDWNIGLQQQLQGAQQVTNQGVNRQSIIAFVSSYPPDGASNYVLDGTLD